MAGYRLWSTFLPLILTLNLTLRLVIYPGVQCKALPSEEEFRWAENPVGPGDLYWWTKEWEDGCGRMFAYSTVIWLDSPLRHHLTYGSSLHEWLDRYIGGKAYIKRQPVNCKSPLALTLPTAQTPHRWEEYTSTLQMYRALWELSGKGQAYEVPRGTVGIYITGSDKRVLSRTTVSGTWTCWRSLKECTCFVKLSGRGGGDEGGKG